MEVENLTALIAIVNAVVAGGPVVWILSALVVIGEALPFITKTGANGIVHGIVDKIKKLK